MIAEAGRSNCSSTLLWPSGRNVLITASGAVVRRALPGNASVLSLVAPDSFTESIFISSQPSPSTTFRTTTICD